MSDQPVPEVITLERATEQMAPLLRNLIELYTHDLSDIFPVDLGPDGRYGYDQLERYWTESDVRIAFLIKCGARVAGFTLVTCGSPATHDPADFDVAEFFVLRRFRRSGVGRQAAFQLWNTIAGHWAVRVSEANRSAVLFWREAVHAYTSGTFNETTRPGSPARWRVFTFESGPRR